jgi:hypothetical protein
MLNSRIKIKRLNIRDKKKIQEAERKMERKKNKSRCKGEKSK